MRILDLELTPVAFRDPPLLNSTGLHEPLALRCVLRLHVDGGVVGLGECPGDRGHLDRLAAVREHLIGHSVYALHHIERAVERALAGVPDPIARRATFSAVEVACLDAQGRLAGVPVAELLGGAVRPAVPYAAYLFYKWAAHPGGPADEWGPATTPRELVEQAERMIGRYGFRSVKLKGGVLAPDEEIAAVQALSEALPGVPLRLDPNGAWTVGTARRVAEELDGTLEYLEDPVLGLDGMADVAAAAPMPLASNMLTTSLETLYPAARRGAVQVVLADHHYWGGLRATQRLATVCAALGLELSMHSNSHLGISLAAMTHLAAAIPTPIHACDTHYPWNAADDVVVPGTLRFTGGAVPVPGGPGLGVELDHDALARLHETYVRSGRQVRDDTGYLRRFQPDFDPTLPRW
ncbi:enolase C-terminal domain-like protein [Nonomuraea sp. NPDC050783]|uniref:enolase C-terminal domain-like protein n=1 Tax=Nonomuraea sp. NPDC050783 TaxID=3154634 RepID=UPI0034669765